MNLWAQREREHAITAPATSWRSHGVRLLLAAAVALATYALFPSAPAAESPIYEIGTVAPDNVIAPVGFKVDKSSAELARERLSTASNVQPIFIYTPAAADSSSKQLHEFTIAVNGLRNNAAVRAGDAALLQSKARELGIALTAPEAMYLDNPARRSALTDAVGRTFERWLPLGVASNGALQSVRGDVTVQRDGIAQVRDADSLPTFSTLASLARIYHPDPQSSVANALYLKLLSAFFHPTLSPDHSATDLRKLELARAVSPYKYEVREGEKIVGAHEVVGREEYEKLHSLRTALQQQSAGPATARRVVGALLINLLLVATFGITLLLFRPQLYQSFRVVALFAIIFLLVLGGAAVVSHAAPSHVELIPIAFAAVLVSVLTDARISLVAAIILSVLVSVQGPFRGSNALIVCMLGGVAAAFSVRVVRRRNQAYYSMLTISIAYALAAVALGLSLDWSPRQILDSTGYGAVIAVISVALAMGLLPPAEEFTGIDTYLKLLEWSDLNRPLMRRLSLEAPGTYAHTIAMANLVEAACNAIGANGLLGRVGTYYHDIGKLKKPGYFVENQQAGRNPHDKLKPSTSASIIRNHVREGLELAEEYHVPKSVAAFIPEHHGTAQISYFFEKARERDGGAATGEFSYPGPIPQSAETAICMLADGVEAAVRVLDNPTAPRIKELVDHIVKQRVERGQLRDTPLTLKQIETIKEQFTRILLGMYHSRIDYPAASGGVSSEFASV